MVAEVDSVVEEFLQNDRVPSNYLPFIQEEAMSSTPSVAEFYTGKNILITGATGFLGGLLLEKLLRSCPGVEKMYVLIRENKRNGENAEKRLKKLLSSQIFQLTTQEDLQKVVAVPADVSVAGLGLSATDCQMLRDNVSVVFHVAASLNFNAPLPSAINTNLLGTRRVLKLCQIMRKIKALVYVSTAYCNCTQRYAVTEQVYPTIYDPDELIASISKMSPTELADATPKILCGHPNTYSFTKLLAENLILKERGKIPVAIVRPSIILGTLKEPFEGWLDNVHNGAFAFIAGAGKGVFRTILADGKMVADMVPCDLVVNLVIAAASHISFSDKEVKVFHMTSGDKNPLRWDDYASLTIAGIHRNPCLAPVWLPGARCRTNMPWAAVKLFTTHYIPAFLFYAYYQLKGHNHRLVDIQNKYVRGMLLSKYFTTNEWRFITNNTEVLASSMSKSDLETFNFDVAQIKWPEYIEKCTLGVKRFFHKEGPKTDKIARKHQARVLWIDMVAKVVTVSLIYLALKFLIGSDLISLFFALIGTYVLFFV